MKYCLCNFSGVFNTILLFLLCFLNVGIFPQTFIEFQALAQEPRDWKNISGTVVLKSGTLDVERTLQDFQDYVPTNVYVRTDTETKSARFARLSDEDRTYVLLVILKKVLKENNSKTTSSESFVSVDSNGDTQKMNSGNESTVSDPFSQTEPGARATFTYKGIEFAFRYCPPGSFPFTYGVGDDVEERSIQEGFWICETETTQEQWIAVAAPVLMSQTPRFKGAKLPVETVSWNESMGFIKQLNKLDLVPEGWNFDLPTEEQWEYACRAGMKGENWGSLDDSAWYCENSERKTHKVGTLKPNKWGIYDMLGNVWEMTKTEHKVAIPNTVWYGVRGGAWNYDAQFCQPGSPDYYGASEALDILGFRVVLVPCDL